MVRKLKKGSVKVLLLLLSLVLIITPLSASSETEESKDTSVTKTDTDNKSKAPDTYEKLAENNNLAMYYNKKSGDFYIQDKRTNSIWRSTLENSKTPRFKSQLILNYADKSNNPNNELNSFNDSVSKGGLSVKTINNGVLATYTFKKAGYVIPVEYKLLEDGLEVNVKAGDIQESAEKPIVNFSLIPYFGAGDKDSKGYMVVPDGSGAVINYNNSKNNYDPYRQYMYGRDDSIEVQAKNASLIDPKLPIFGVKNGDSAMLGVIHSGSSRSVVNATVAGAGSLNTVYSEFIYHDLGEAKFNGKKWNSENVMLIEKEPASIENYTVRYYFLPKDQSNYTGMALRYQKYLQDAMKVEKTVKADEYPFYLNLFGNVRKLDNILGFPVNKDIPLTTYKDAENILGQLKNSGVDDIVLKYSAWLKGGPDSSVPVDVKLSGALGGKKAFANLTKYMSSNGIANFFDLDLNGIYKDRFGYSRKSDSAKGLNYLPAMEYRFKPSTYQKNDFPPLYLLKPTKVASASTKVADRLKDFNITGAALDSLGNKLYSSFNEKGMDRESTKNTFVDSIQKVKESKGQIMMDAPNDYVLPYTFYLSSIPVQSSGYSIEDYDIPFYQIAMHGITSYSMPANNQTSDYKKSILKALETGSSMQFTWIAQNIQKIQDTPYDTLYSAEYTDWIYDAVNSYKDISGVMKKVAASKITGHDKLQDGVVKTTYDNGVSILVNYSSEKVYIDGTSVDAMSYRVGEAK